MSRHDKELLQMTPLNTSYLAACFERAHAGRLRKVAAGKSSMWFLYESTGSHKGTWREVPVDVVHGMVEDFIEAEEKRTKAASIGDDDNLAKYKKDKERFLNSCQSTRQVHAIASHIGARQEVLARLDDFDKDPHVVAVANGVLELSGKSPKLVDFSPTHLLRKKAAASYVHGAGAKPEGSTFLRFVEEITADEDGALDPDLARWIQKLYGYTLSGMTNEDVIPIYIGTGCNGKSKLMEAVDYALGSYAGLTDIQELAGSSRFYSANNEALADLHGLRFAWCDEMPMNGAWDPAKFKRLTGGTTRAMRKYEPARIFRSTCVIHLGGQHLPAALDLSHGFWRRVRVVPFRRTFDETRDEHLLDKLKVEADVVMEWMVDGWKLWREEGLGSCSAVDKATASYRETEEENTPLGYLKERCVVSDPANVDDPAARTPHNALYPDYVDWCKKTGNHNWGKRNFKGALEAAGYVYARNRYVPVGQSITSFDGRADDMPRGYVWHGIQIPGEGIGVERWRP